MREHTRAFCKYAAQVFRCKGTVAEFGSRQYPGEGVDADLRPLFEGCEYLGCDMLDGPGVDRIENLAALNFPDDSLSTVLCIETMEHVFEIQKAFSEIHRVLAPGGMVLVTTPFRFRIHGFPDDYWRLTPSCLQRLFERFGAWMVGSQGTKKFPHTVMGVAVKAPVPPDFWRCGERFRDVYCQWLEEQKALEGWRKKIRRLLGPFRLTKGERKELKYEHFARFDICPQPDSVPEPHFLQPALSNGPAHPIL